MLAGHTSERAGSPGKVGKHALTGQITFPLEAVDENVRAFISAVQQSSATAAAAAQDSSSRKRQREFCYHTTTSPRRRSYTAHYKSQCRAMIAELME
jgi:hypothetical protein